MILVACALTAILLSHRRRRPFEYTRVPHDSRADPLRCRRASVPENNAPGLRLAGRGGPGATPAGEDCPRWGTERRPL